MPENFQTTPIKLDDDLKVSHLGEYFGVWAIHEETFRATVDRFSGFDLRSHIIARMEAKDVVAARDPQTVGMASKDERKLAIVSIDGPMMKYASSLSGGTSTVAIRQQLRELTRDDSVAGVMLKIFSPGGTVSGNKDLADEITTLAGKKPVHAFIEDLGASAAYWIASQTQRISTNPTGMVGSIGTFAVITDSSGAAKDLGFKVHVIRSGDFKGVGTPGTEITDDQLAEFQRNVDSLNEHFLAAVQTGRKMTKKQVKDLADGRVHVGEEALTLGLVDAVSSFDDAMNELAAASRSAGTPSRGRAASSSNQPEAQARVNSIPERKKAMDETTTPKAATLAELKAEFPQTDSKLNAEQYSAFLLAQLEKGATIADAKSALAVAQRDAEIAKLKSDLETANAAKADADKKAADATKAAANPAPAPKKPGTSGLGTEGTAPSSSGDAVSEWDAAIKAEMDAGRDKVAATRNVIRANPQLHESYLQAVNSGRKARSFQPAG